MAPNEKTGQEIRIINHSQNASEMIKQYPFCNPGEEVVISGIAGVFPESDNVEELGKNFLSKKDMITNDDRRWIPDNPNIPHRTGKIRELNRFDATFFGIAFEKAEAMDPQGRIAMEKAYEAIIDAGYNPAEFKKSKTAVFISTSGSESIAGAYQSPETTNNPNSILGFLSFMPANRISYWLDVNGPSHAIDGGCSSSIITIENAFSAIRSGACNAALVIGCNLCLTPDINRQFFEIGVLSRDGRCKSFDESADGYVRSETVAAMLLQKKKDARRMYARIVHAKVNADGRKTEGQHFPSVKMQTSLFNELYEECHIDVNNLDFLECHATGTKTGDYVELQSVWNSFLKNRKEPLKIGAMKSMMGHSECASAIAAVIKVILSYEYGIIFPNINFKAFPSYIEPHIREKIKFVSEPTPWDGGLAGVNNYGFGGTNGHALLQPNSKKKLNNGAPIDKLPRLVLVSGRTMEAVDVMLTDLESKSLDVEYVALFHEIHKYDIPNHNYRGYTILQKDEPKRIRDFTHFSGAANPIWFVYPGMGSQWPTMGKALMKIPAFAESIQNCQDALMSKDVNLIKILTEDDPKMFDSVINACTGTVAMNIALTDLLTKIGIAPEGFIGHSFGELCCAYVDGCITAEQAMLLAYYRGAALQACKLKEGAMAAVGLDYETLIRLLPYDLDIACHNSSDNYTVAGPRETVEQFVRSLQKKQIFCRLVRSLNLAAHSRYIKDIEPIFRDTASSVIKAPKLRSKKWISTTFLEADWLSEKCKYYSIEHVINNIVGAVYFEQALHHIPDNATVIEISPNGFFQAILSRSLNKNVINIPLTSRNHPDNVIYLLQALGRLYETGTNFQISKLYPPVEFPVSKGTPIISRLVRWYHDENWYTFNYKNLAECRRGHRFLPVSLRNEKDEYLQGHILNGKTLYPAAGHLVQVWESLSFLNIKSHLNVAVTLENIRFHKTTQIVYDEYVRYSVIVHKNSNNFEIFENNHLIVTGKVFELDNISVNEETNKGSILNVENEEDLALMGYDIYNEFRLRGHNYGKLFRGITYMNSEGTSGCVLWHDNFVCFLDSMIQMQTFLEDRKTVTFPSYIKSVTINPQKHFKILQTLDKKNPEFKAYVNKELNNIECGGVKITGIEFRDIAENEPQVKKWIQERKEFVPYTNSQARTLTEVVRICTQIVLGNRSTTSIETVELIDDCTETEGLKISKLLHQYLQDSHVIQSKMGVVNKNQHFQIPDELKHSAVEYEELPCNASKSVIIASHILNRTDILKICLDALDNCGFLISIENVETECTSFEKEIRIIFNCIVDDKRILLLRKVQKIEKEPTVIKISQKSFTWISEIKDIVRSSSHPNLILYAEKDPYNGLLGMFDTLKKEIDFENIRCFLILDNTAPAFDIRNSFYQQQLDKNLAVNVYKNGEWGSFHYLLLEKMNSIFTPHAYADALVHGNLGTLQWIEGPLNPVDYEADPDSEKVLIHVYYASINTRDVVLATGKMSVDEFFRSSSEKKATQGMEFVGKTSDGRRFMGSVHSMAIANVVECNNWQMLPVPDNWSFEDAATVYYAYGKVLQVLRIHEQLEIKGKSILIHSGTCDIGLAAIIICLHYECKIFITVDSLEKRQFIRKTFPTIPETNIGNQDDEDFERNLMMMTDGEGVDLILNAMPEDRKHADVHLVAQEGRILEIGKMNKFADALESIKCSKVVAFNAIGLDSPYLNKKVAARLNDLMEELIKKGIIQPLPRTVFDIEEIKTAYRYLATGRAIGKVAIKIRDEESDFLATPNVLKLKAVLKYTCRSDRSYIICNGHERFGFELADWLVERGARNLIINSTEGVCSGYQVLKLKLWKSHGAKISILMYDITKEEDVKKLLETAASQKPIAGIFNSIAAPDYKLFENQTEESFAASNTGKIQSSFLLDKLTRKLCPYLEQFVIISNIGGNASGLTSYAMCQSSLERICEQRKTDSLPALFIQCGTISEIALAEVNCNSKDGISQQNMRSSLEFLDQFSKQQNGIIRHLTIGERQTNVENEEQSILDVVIKILGLRNKKAINLQSTLAESGLDSLKVSEIKRILENDYKVSLTITEIANLTFLNLLKIGENSK